MLKFTKPEAVQVRFKGLFYGDWGVGKTTQMIQFPKMAFVVMERGSVKYWISMESNGSLRIH